MPFSARAARPAGTVLQRLGIARCFDMDDEAEAGKIDAARRHVGSDADPGAPVAQRLKRLVAFVLAVLARQRDRREAALDQAGVEMPDLVARRAEQDRGLRLVKAQQVDHAFSISDGAMVIA
jgi:hypothetical protein